MDIENWLRIRVSGDAKSGSGVLVNIFQSHLPVVINSATTRVSYYSLKDLRCITM